MYRLREDHTYHMPAHFGGQPGGLSWVCRCSDVHALSLVYETDRDRLEAYVHEDFELLRPEVSVQMSQMRMVDFMANGGYNLVQVSVPVAYRREAGLTGVYPLVVWENQTWPIIGGREETGVPKIFADIADLHSRGDHVFTCASFWSRTFLELDFFGKRDANPEELAQNNRDMERIHLLGYRYIPNVGGPGAALSQATLYPQAMRCDRVVLGEGALRWHVPAFPEHHPEQHHILRALGELPLGRMVDARLLHGEITMNPPDARTLP